MCRDLVNSPSTFKTGRAMAVVHALDDYYLAITFLITVAYQLFFFAIAFSLKFDKLTGKSSDDDNDGDGGY